ncbi:hypothetical protein VYU27_001908 [Nannochloropsis oceanica]
MQRPSVKKGQHKKPPPSSSPPSHAAATSSLFSFHVLALLSVYAFAAFFFFYFWQGKQTHEKAMYETQNLTLDHLRQCASIRTAPEDTHFAASMSWSEQSNQRAQEVLAYVTPWNRQGFVVAETYAHKLTYLAPVWYQLRKQHQQQEQQQHQRQQLELTGKHEFNGTWLDNVRHKSGRVRIVPRVIWEVPAFVNPEQVAEVVGLLVDEAKERNYDGYTLEFPIDARGVFAHLTSSLKASLSQAIPPSLPPILIVAIPAFQMPTRPATPREMHVTPSMLLSLSPHVDRFSLMTYDYGRDPSGAPNSPLGWMEETIESFVQGRKEGGADKGADLVKIKMLLGLPWYGYVGGQAIVGHEFERKVLERPEKVRRFEWGEESQELIFSLRGEGGRDGRRQDEMVGTFPTPAFFWRRFALVSEMGMAGIAVWEVGQGLECFPMLW